MIGEETSTRYIEYLPLEEIGLDPCLAELGYIVWRIREPEIGSGLRDVIRKSWGDWARKANTDPGPDAL